MEEIDISEVNKKNAVKDVSYDDVLSSAGEIGRYQLLLVISMVPFYFFGVCIYFSQLFITEVPLGHWCWVPELENLTVVERRNLAIPKSNASSGYSHCEVFDANWTEVLETGDIPNNTATVPCRNGWEFDRTEIPYPTISSDLEWVCEKKSYQATAQAVFFTGSVVGGILIGSLADRFGRVPATIVSNLLGCIGGVTSSFATTFYHFAICRFIMGMAFDTCMMIPYLIVLEYTAPKYRSILANSSFAVFFCIFATSFPFVALACGHWKILSLVSSVPLVLAVLTPLFFPESPRWLLSEGRVDEVISRIQVIGKINRKRVPTDMINKFKETCQKEEKNDRVNMYDLLKRPLLRRNMILVCLLYMAGLIVFDCLFRNLEQLQFDFFLSFAASSATELPSMLLCAFVMDILGRRWLTFVMLAINSIACISTTFVGDGIPSLLCAVVARFVINMSVSTTLQWSAELLPTPVRGLGVSIVIICGNLAMITSPYISLLKFYSGWLPFLVMGGIAGVGAVIALMLPETARIELPSNFDEAEDLAKNQRIWNIFCSKSTKTDESIGRVNPSFSQ